MKLKSFFIWLLGVLAAALTMASAMAQTPADVLKSGTTFTIERKFTDQWGKVLGQSSFMVRINAVAAGQVGATRIENSKELPIANILGESAYLLAGIQFPLPAVGTTWTHDTKFKRPYQGLPADYQYNGKATLVGEELITIAGQSVKTVKIQYTGNISAIGSGQGATLGYTQTRWYAPELGYVVKFIGTETDRHTYTAELTVTKIDLPAAANPAAAPATTTPIAAAAAAAPEQPKQ